MNPEHARSTKSIDRQSFLKMSAAGVTGAFLLGSMGASKVLAQDRGDSTLVAEFEEAARKYDVPVDVLLAMGYTNTRLEMPPPETNEYEKGDLHGWGSYGIMALVKNPSSNTLGEASRLTGIPEEKLKTDRKANIMGGAALLAKSQGRGKPEVLGEWFGAVDGRGGRGPKIKAVAGIGAGDIYAKQVFRTLEDGARTRTKRGEKIVIRSRSLSTQGNQVSGGSGG